LVSLFFAANIKHIYLQTKFIAIKIYFKRFNRIYFTVYLVPQDLQSCGMEYKDLQSAENRIINPHTPSIRIANPNGREENDGSVNGRGGCADCYAAYGLSGLNNIEK
jgi:hypothetical protein